MSNFFEEAISLNDLSKQMLDRLFGPGWDSLRVTDQLEGAGTEVASLFFSMLGQVNVVVLTLIGVYMSYIFVFDSRGYGLKRRSREAA